MFALSDLPILDLRVLLAEELLLDSVQNHSVSASPGFRLLTSFGNKPQKTSIDGHTAKLRRVWSPPVESTLIKT